MAVTYFNSTEVESIAKDINELSYQFEEEINKLFNRFEGVPTMTKEWIGNKSTFYFNRISLDKRKYTDFAESLRKISYNLNDTVNEVNKSINETKVKELEKGN